MRLRWSIATRQSDRVRTRCATRMLAQVFPFQFSPQKIGSIFQADENKRKREKDNGAEEAPEAPKPHTTSDVSDSDAPPKIPVAIKNRLRNGLFAALHVRKAPAGAGAPAGVASHRGSEI